MPAPQTPVRDEKPGALLWWLLGLLLVALFVLLAGTMLLARYFLPSVQVARDGDQVAISTPVGDIYVDRTEHTDPGLPIFPGAQVSDRGAVIELTPPGDDPVAILAVRYRTRAPLVEVDAWYREQLGSEFVREDAGRSERRGKIFGVDIRANDIVFLSEADGLMQAVVLRRERLHTEIALVRLSRRETL